jgi:hypothetical protein
MTGVAGIAAVAVMLAIGLPIALAIGRVRALMLASLALLYGSGVVFVVMQTLSLSGVRWSAATVLGCCAAIALLAAIVWRKRQRVALPPPTRFTFIDAVTLFLLGWFARMTLAQPPHSDFVGIWGLKGRMFTEAAGIDWVFFRMDWAWLTHPTYPLLVPINFAFPALLGGVWSEQSTSVLVVAWTVALVLFVRAYAPEECSPRVASAIALAVTALTVSWALGSAEPPLLAYATAGLLLIRRGVASAIWPAHASLLLPLAASTKNEGLALLAAVAFGLIVAGRWRWIVRLWPAILICGPWLIAQRLQALSLYLVEGDAGSRVMTHLAEWQTIAALVWEYLEWPQIWLSILLAFALGGMAAIRRERFLLAALALQAVFFLGAYFLTPHGLRWHIANSATRLCRQLIVPLTIPAMSILASVAFRRRDEESYIDRPSGPSHAAGTAR